MFPEMAVVGVGLIGGSLALAARKAGLVETVTGVDADPIHREVALATGMVDRAAAELTADLSRAGLVVLAVPVAEIVALLPEVARHVKDGCLVTDVGSVKGPILAAGDTAFPDGRFVAGHPIAGQERSGPAAARPDLFEGANWIVTPSALTNANTVERVSALWRGVGSTIVTMEADWHDEVFAAVSHLPHLVAYALMDAVLGLPLGEERLQFAAGGLRDFTRVAASHPLMWRDIFLMNRDPILRALAAYRGVLAALEGAIRDGDGEALTARLARARVAREEITHRP
ncbi:MAG: prephenate dehydrogenase/arogenate dehydrogenase family protein [Candidatus Methylomirabilota bacterium]